MSHVYYHILCISLFGFGLLLLTNKRKKIASVVCKFVIVGINCQVIDVKLVIIGFYTWFSTTVDLSVSSESDFWIWYKLQFKTLV